MRNGFWNLLTVLVFLAALVVILIFGYIFLFPDSFLNPLAPPALPTQLTLPTSTATLKQLPEINTPTQLAELPTDVNTSTPKPSSTPLPTFTSFVLPSATITPTPTNTTTSTPTASPTSAAYQCQVVSTFPALGATYPHGGDFDGRWTIKNVGTEVWEAGVDLVYMSGTKFHPGPDAVDLPSAVANGASVEVIVDMFAPRDPGTYETNWSLRKDGTYFCELKLVIKVVQ
jgi:hypothetical protein